MAFLFFLPYVAHDISVFQLFTECFEFAFFTAATLEESATVHDNKHPKKNGPNTSKPGSIFLKVSQDAFFFIAFQEKDFLLFLNMGTETSKLSKTGIMGLKSGSFE